MRRLLAAVLLLAASTASASAQDVRGTLSNALRYIEIRPIARDTVDSALVTMRPNGGLEFEGKPVFCSASVCTFYRPADVEHAVTSAHDLSLTAWGLGVNGLSATVLLRVRTEAGGDFTWPRADEPFDAILAYADFAREHYRVRVGRQRTTGGLGFYSFDGVSARYDVTPAFNVEGYAGRSLARGLEEPRHSALAAVENFLPDEQAWLIGGAVELDLAHSNASFRYQRELWADRSALISERAAADFTSSVLAPIQVEGGADYDVAFGQLGKAHVTMRLPLRNGLSLEVSGRRYRPFFELWTIWGVFSPVAYHEAEIQASYARGRLGVQGSAGVRKYEDAEAPVFPSGPKDDARTIALGARFDATSSIRVSGDLRFENGFGAYLGSGELGAAWQAAGALRLSAYATAFQQILEFRIGEAAVLGFGAAVDYELSDRIGLSGAATLYRQQYENRPSAVDWNQKRAWFSLEWRFGEDPGLVQARR